mgnify:CR=1 FL=1
MDVLIADPLDAHAAGEFSFHLQAPVRLIRGSLAVLTEPPPPVNKNIFTMSEREKKRLKVKQLPANLTEALDNLEKDQVVMNALGSHIAEAFLNAKRQEWAEYISAVHTWEQDRYLGSF